MKNLARLFGLFLVTLPVTSNAVNFSPTMDSYVRSDYPDTNYGASTWMQSGPDVTNHFHNYLQFNLSSIPSSSIINSAILYQYIFETNGPTIALIHPIKNDTAWSETTLTWNNRPPGTIECGTCLTPPTTVQWMQLDVKTAVQNWVNGSWENYGLRVITAGDFYFKTYTKENSSFQPYLTVDYSPGTKVVTPSLGVIKAFFKPTL